MLRVLLLVLLACALGDAGAQAWPVRPLRIIVSQAAGGTPDIICRIVTERVSRTLGQQLIVDNRPGSGNVIGAQAAARATADGYTLFFATAAALVTNPYTFKSLPYDPQRDFTPVGMVAKGPFFVLAHPSVPAKTLAELIALARAKPGQLNYASSGNGTTPHLALEMLKGMAKIDLVHVPYKGVAPALTDTIGGQVQVFLSAQQAALPQIKAGKVRALAVSGARRSRALPEVPTIAESGFPGFDVNGWLGLHLPLKTPRALIARIHDDIARALGPADVQERILTSGMEPVTMTSAEFDTWVRNDFARYRRVASDAHIRAE